MMMMMMMWSVVWGNLIMITDLFFFLILRLWLLSKFIESLDDDYWSRLWRFIVKILDTHWLHKSRPISQCSVKLMNSGTFLAAWWWTLPCSTSSWASDWRFRVTNDVMSSEVPSLRTLGHSLVCHSGLCKFSGASERASSRGWKSSLFCHSRFEWVWKIAWRFL